MGVADARTEQLFSVEPDELYGALIASLPGAGFEVLNADPMIRRVNANANMSAFSWGEHVVMSIVPAPSGSVLHVQSTLKVGFNLAAAGRNSQNAERVIRAVSDYLQRPQPTPEAPSDTYTHRQNPFGWPVIALMGFILIAAFASGAFGAAVH